MTEDSHEQADVTMLLDAWGAGKQEALDELMPLDHARKQHSDERGGGEALIPFEEAKGVPAKAQDLVALDDALTDFATSDPERSKGDMRRQS